MLNKFRKNGERGMHRYIISNSDTVEDVMNVFALFKVCGYQDKDINIDIVPLLKPWKDLANAEKVMQDLYNDEVYQKTFGEEKKRTNNYARFSDGTKDGGYLKANWEIYTTKERLSKVSEENDVKVIFFDGRGGPPARGGGKTHQFYKSRKNNCQ